MFSVYDEEKSDTDKKEEGICVAFVGRDNGYKKLGAFMHQFSNRVCGKKVDPKFAQRYFTPETDTGPTLAELFEENFWTPVTKKTNRYVHAKYGSPDSIGLGR